MSDKNFIHFDNVSKRYPAHPTHHDALKNITFRVAPNSLTFVTGPSGAGKSTLFKLLALMERPTNGEIYVAGNSLNKTSNHQIPSYRQKLGIVFQEPMLLNDRNVQDNIALALHLNGVPKSEFSSQVEAALSLVKMREYALYNPLSLSAGQRQRIGLARALVRHPKIILADEPTGNLDPDLSEKIMQLLISINQTRKTCIMIATHEIALVERFKKSHAFHEIKLKNGFVQ